MSQAGIHSMVGVAVRKWMPAREWLVLSVVVGTLLPDTDNLAVAVATITGGSTEGLHRSFTHSLFTVAAIIIVFQLIAVVAKRPIWGNLGLGLGIGVLTHILIDLVVWFNGVYILWPLPLWLNFWEGVIPPEWFSQLMMPAEVLCFAIYFWGLAELARKQGTNGEQLKWLRIWTAVESVLFLILLVLVYTMESGFLTIYGALYLLSLGLAIALTIRMRQTIETIGQIGYMAPA